MHLGNGVIFLVGSEQVIKEDVVSSCHLFSLLSDFLFVQIVRPRKSALEGQAAFLNSHHKTLEPLGKPEPCLWKNLLPPPGERELLIFALFLWGDVLQRFCLLVWS